MFADRRSPSDTLMAWTTRVRRVGGWPGFADFRQGWYGKRNLPGRGKIASFSKIQTRVLTGELTVPNSVLEAIKQGIWDYEPQEEFAPKGNATSALPGPREKLDVLAERVRQGLPLWNPRDRICYDGEQDQD